MVAQGKSLVQKRVKRMFRGDNVLRNELPWVAQIKKRGDEIPFCVGTIVDASWILTALHCIVIRNENGNVISRHKPTYNREDLMIVVGTTQLSGAEGESFYIHDMYPNLDGADLCLIQVKNLQNFSDSTFKLLN